MAAAQITERQELANSELLKLLKDTQDELDEIKSMLPQEQEPLSEDIIDVDA